MFKQKIIQGIKNNFKKFPVTTAIIWVATLLITIFYSSDIKNIIQNICIFFTGIASGSFLIEIALKGKKKIIPYVADILVSSIFTYYLYNASNLDILNNSVFRYYFCYILVILIFSLYCSFRKSNLTFEKYLKNTITSIFKTSIIYVLLAIVSFVIAELFMYLIISVENALDVIARIEILILGMYYIPQVVSLVDEREDKEDEFSKVIFKYVLDVVIMIAFCIIYMYFAKVLILRQIPKNTIFSVVALLFTFAMPIWTVASGYEGKNILNKINNILPMLFSPFILLQIYSIGVRIHSNGLTEARYLAVMLVIFEVIYILMYIFKRNKIENVIIVFGVLSVISLAFPYINMVKLSEYSQYRNLKLYNTRENLSQEDKAKIEGAYYYLTSKDIDVSSIVTEEKIRNLEYVKEDESTYYYASTFIPNIDVSGYSTVNILDKSEYEDLNYLYEYGEESIDISPVIQNLVENRENLQDYLDNNLVKIDIDENRCIIVNYIDFTYDEKNNIVKDYRVNGYLLIK